MKDFISREPGECCFLVDHMRVCAEPVAGKAMPYCGEHMSLCYAGRDAKRKMLSEIDKGFGGWMKRGRPKRALATIASTSLMHSPSGGRGRD
jgi:hypothetical protein